MAYFVSHKGSPLSQLANDTAPYVLQRSVTLERAIGERPVGTMSVRVPAGATFAPADLDEITIDYPARPYRAEAESHANLVAYWRLDEAAVTTAVDSNANGTPLTFGGAGDLQYRSFRSEDAAVPYGGAPEWEHTTGAGLTGTLPSGIDPEFTIGGFVRLVSAAAGVRDVWTAGASNRRLRIDADGSIACRMGTGTMTAPAGTVTEDAWHHVAVLRTATGRELWVDGELVDSQSGTGASFDGRAWTMAVAVGGDAVNLALDEWGIWSSAIDVAALYARARHERLFGGYVFGVVDNTVIGAGDDHTLDLSLAGYGLRLDTTPLREVYASATGSSVRAIVADVLSRSGLGSVFSSHGVELEDIVTRAVYPVEWVMEILRSPGEAARGHRDGRRVARDRHGAAKQRAALGARARQDELREHRTDHRTAVLRGSRGRGRARRAGHHRRRAYDGRRDARFDASQPIGEVQSITVDGVEQTFDGTGARWEIDTDQQRFELAAGETPDPAGATGNAKFLYISAEAIVVTVDSTTSTAPFRVARRIRDDSIDTPGVARVVAQSEVDRSDQPFEEFVASTRPGHVRSIAPGVAPSFTFPRQKLAATRLLVENVSSVLGVGENEGEHSVIHTVRATALDYQGDAGDDLRRPGQYQPPAPRPMTPTAADPDQTIIRPENVAAPAQLPINLGGYPSDPITNCVVRDPDRRALGAG